MVFNGPATSFTDSQLNRGKTYYYSFTAVNLDSKTARTFQKVVQIPDWPYPSNFQFFIIGNFAHFEWNNPTSNEFEAVDLSISQSNDYDIQYTGTNEYYSFEINPGVTYDTAIRSKLTEGGNTPYIGVTENAKAVPTNRIVQPDQQLLTWTNPSDPLFERVQIIRLAKDESFTRTSIYEGNGTFFEDTNTPTSGVYAYIIRAIYSDGKKSKFLLFSLQ